MRTLPARSRPATQAFTTFARVAVGRAAEAGEERRPADSALRLDVLLDAAHHDAAARGDVPSGVELEDAEVAGEELGRRAGELGLDELEQLGRLDLRRR